MPINDPISVSRTSLVMLRPLLEALAAPEPVEPAPITGLPVPAVHVRHANIIVAATPITDPTLFADAATAAVRAHGVDVVLIRHGNHPEILDDVVYDVATQASRHRSQPSQCCLFRHGDGGLWLVPVDPDRVAPGACLRVTSAGLVPAAVPPWSDLDERIDGVVLAARQTVLALRT